MEDPQALSIGRDEELRALRTWLHATRTGGGVLVLEGDAGAGKTHLLEVVGDAAEAEGIAVHWLRAHPNFGAAPFFLWRPVLPSTDVVGGAAAPAATQRAALFDAVGDALAQGRAPSLVVADDVHWADADSLDLLTFLVRELRRRPCSLLLAARPSGEERTPWTEARADLLRERRASLLSLGGLDAEATSTLFACASGTHLDDRAAADVHALTGGNPLFVRELAAASGPSTGPDLPGSVTEAVSRRLDRLDATSVPVLTAAAVIGDEFAAAVVASVVDLPVTDVEAALEAAAEVGLVRRTGATGRWRFAHALVHDACRRYLHPAAAPTLHRRAASALEAAGAPAAEVAWHLLASDTPSSEAAAAWAARAGNDALAALAFEDAATWFARAGACGGDDAAVTSRLVGEASAWSLAGRRHECRAAVDTAYSRALECGQPDLGVAAALVAEPIGLLDWDLWIADRCAALLDRLDSDHDALARLQARRAEALLYCGDQEAAEGVAALAMAAADRCGTPAAVVAALRARQLVLAGPEHHDERAALADRMLATGTALRRPDLEAWGRLWRIDAHWERSDLASAAAELPRLRWCAERSGDPRFRWHVLVAQACVEAALGRFDDALTTARDGFELGDRLGVAAAFGAYMNLLGVVGHHIGHDAAMATVPAPVEDQEPSDEGEIRDGIFSFLGPAVALAEEGRTEEALTVFRRAGPPATWRPPPYLRVVAWANGAQAAVALGLPDAVSVVHERLEAERGRTVVAGAGVAAYGGPVELHLGHTAAAMGKLDRAITDLRTALDLVAAAGIVGFEAETSITLAEALRRRNQPSDANAAAELLGRGLALARRHEMTPWVSRAEQVQRSLAAADDPLTLREREVAALVAHGDTNRQIADTLYISERTAQTHVQHILSKLGYTRRAQIAAWVAAGSPPRDT